MMTAKLKAEELVNKYWSIGEQEWQDTPLNWEEAKQCALIAVDELIEHLQPACDFGGEINIYTVEYWQEVKQEIEKL